MLSCLSKIERVGARPSIARPFSYKLVLTRNDFSFRTHPPNCLSENILKVFMKSLLIVFSALLIPAVSAQAATEQEKAFVDKYKTALEAKDTTALQACLYTTGADPMIVGFYKMMQSSGAGDKVSKIELVDLTPDDAKKASAAQDSPSGGKVCLNLKPTKKLVIVIDKKDENGSSTSTTENFIAEKDGKFVIPVPGPCT